MARKHKSESEIVVPSAAAPARNRRKAATTSRALRTGTAALPAVTEDPVTSPADSAVPESAAAATSNQPSHQEIAELAHSYWCDRGCEGGSPEDDWARAEAELRAR